MASVEIEYASRIVLAEFRLERADPSVGSYYEWPDDITLHHPDGKRWPEMERLVTARQDWDTIAEKIMSDY